MTEIIIPHTARHALGNQLAQFLRTRDGQEFRYTVQLTEILATAVQKFSRTHRLDGPRTLKALLGAMVSYVQFAIPQDHWDYVATALAEEIRGRLTVRQVD